MAERFEIQHALDDRERVGVDHRLDERPAVLPAVEVEHDRGDVLMVTSMA